MRGERPPDQEDQLKTLAEMLYHGASVKNKTKSNNLTVGDLGVKHGNQSPD
jgi:sirohydrochlorin ferrochelatase